MGMTSLLFCGVSFALPLFVAADTCKDSNMYNEMISEGQPFPFNCTYPPVTNGAVNLTWYKTPSGSPISNNRHLRIHQEQTWLLFLPLALEDSGIYHCVIRNAHSCYRVVVNLTVFKKHWCDSSMEESPINSPDVYQQMLTIGKSGNLMCHLYFPESCTLDSIKWYKCWR